MAITYKSVDGELNDPVLLEGILRLHHSIFGESALLEEQMKEKMKLRIEIALQENEVLGYKMGYELKKETFYSWLGGVDSRWRGKGIASELMDRQHHYARASSYKTIETRTKNKWRNMLLLNIKNGFDIVGIYATADRDVKIILEKKLF
ncbi:GNAT family N-acetyltransferase [Planococcus sp. NCCP-2050]|uniref:GNAT family N-acetyltransferase n=1 Tax=Planococcus sp. NCCP-2050 TaxID=2944679 RepID=UPI00203E9ECD|nr:GNAT family N-acetyltransferase [Planococcus sp. NCCP-2050]GKW46446.1 hypothetical protein NCCP2050_21380 [Planococcus sp. NCCP-2050]